MARNRKESHKKPESDKIYVTKVRHCLMCRSEFKSAWSGERICTNCKQTQAWGDGPGLAA